ncbi:MAG: carboxypeptidase-like regulatory domain-containing protein [Chloroflexi bacterium]|nr:carboxypeptidase-like regulatory domain-containing protein [Chloroflexota bacterium]
MEPVAPVARQRAMQPPARTSAVVLLPLAVLALVAAILAACSASAPTPTPQAVSSPAAAVQAVQARTPLFDTFGPLNPDMIGQDRWWETQPLDGTDPPTGWTVRFTAGWGDCQAGCIDRHAWTWDVAADGTVTFVSEEGFPLNDQLLAGLRRDAKGPGAGGRVTAGPTCPVERPNDPACAPRAVEGAVLLVRDGSGSEVISETTDGSGLFRFALEPGEYTLEPQPVEGLMGTAAPIAFIVTDGEVAWLDVAYDTGIR